MKAFSNFAAPAWAILESPLSSVFICSLWCLSACLCLLLTLVRVCVYSPSCLIFPHSLLAFIIMKLPKQLQPSQQEQAGQLLLRTHTVSFLSHTFCSAQPPSGHSCVCLMWNWVEQRHDAKAVVWWAWWKVESSSRWPLSGGGGCVWGGGVKRLWQRNGLVSLWPDMLSRGNDIISMVKTAQFQFILGAFFLLLLLIAGIESWHGHFVLLKAVVTSGHFYCYLNSVIMIIVHLFNFFHTFF